MFCHFSPHFSRVMRPYVFKSWFCITSIRFPLTSSPDMIRCFAPSSYMLVTNNCRAGQGLARSLVTLHHSLPRTHHLQLLKHPLTNPRVCLSCSCSQPGSWSLWTWICTRTFHQGILSVILTIHLFLVWRRQHFPRYIFRFLAPLPGFTPPRELQDAILHWLPQVLTVLWAVIYLGSGIKYY